MTFCEIDLDEVGAEYINETKKDKMLVTMKGGIDNVGYILQQ